MSDLLIEPIVEVVPAACGIRPAEHVRDVLEAVGAHPALGIFEGCF